MFFPRNYRGGPDPHLEIKTVVFVLGAGLAIVGMVYDVGWLITIAIVLLAVTLIGARVARARRAADGTDEMDEPVNGEPGP